MCEFVSFFLFFRDLKGREIEGGEEKGEVEKKGE